jgi:hypothetical protein
LFVFVNGELKAFRHLGQGQRRTIFGELFCEDRFGAPTMVLLFPRATNPDEDSIPANDGTVAHLLREVLEALRADLALGENPEG